MILTVSSWFYFNVVKQISLKSKRNLSGPSHNKYTIYTVYRSVWTRYMDRVAALSPSYVCIGVLMRKRTRDSEKNIHTCPDKHLCATQRSVRAVLTCYILSTWSSSGSSEARGVAFPPALSTGMTCISTLSPWLHLCQNAETTPLTEQQHSERIERLFLCSQSWK